MRPRRREVDAEQNEWQSCLAAVVWIASFCCALRDRTTSWHARVGRWRTGGSLAHVQAPAAARDCHRLARAGREHRISRCVLEQAVRDTRAARAGYTVAIRPKRS